MVKKFDWKIALRKFGVNFLYAAITGFIILWQDDIRFIAIIPLAKYMLNVLKHKYDWL